MNVPSIFAHCNPGFIQVVLDFFVLVDAHRVDGCVRGLFSPKVPNSSFAELRMGLLIEPTHMEDEDEKQENEKEDERR